MMYHVLSSFIIITIMILFYKGETLRFELADAIGGSR